ncbi:MAG: hypothetical protein LBG11_11425, partial [Bifidobacteriaceae bacterium]|jgi:LPXTG-motif cell wall-anchored protein|nr:hypothetical protein [Bifidobacteriaceae bacterium]
LGGNRFTSLPDSGSNLTNLEWLHLGDNQLICLPEAVIGANVIVYLEGNPGYSEETETMALCATGPGPSPSASSPTPGSPQPSGSATPILPITGNASSGLAVGAGLLVLAGALMTAAARRRAQTMV